MSTRYDEDREKAERDPRRNEAIFDGGCARFVPKEGHDFCHGQDMGIVGTIQKGPVSAMHFNYESDKSIRHYEQLTDCKESGQKIGESEEKPMADLRVYADDGDQDGGTLGYSGFTGEPKQREWMMTEVGKIQFVNDSGMSWAERAALIKHIERTRL
jgi:hypothetical protein